jgi:hypothetical protein
MKYSFHQKKEFKEFIEKNHEKLTIQEICSQLRISARLVMDIKVELGFIRRRFKKAKVIPMHTDVFNVHVMKNWLTGAE